MLNIFLKLRRRVLPASWQKQRGRSFAKTTTQVNEILLSFIIYKNNIFVFTNNGYSLTIVMLYQEAEKK